MAIAACREKTVATQSDTTGGVIVPAAKPAEDTGLVGPPTQDEAATRFYMAAVTWESQDSSAYEGEFPCEGCGRDPVKLRIVPAQRAYKIDWPTALVNRDNRGWIVAKITNVSDVAFLPLNLQPQETAYQWVGPIDNDGTDRGVAFYKIDLSSGSSGAAMAVSHTVEYCTVPDWRRRKNSSAHKDHPTQSTKCAKTRFGMVAPVAKLTAARFPGDGTWLSCVGGCCKIMSD
jgi:hypothetical protein